LVRLGTWYHLHPGCRGEGRHGVSHVRSLGVVVVVAIVIVLSVIPIVIEIVRERRRRSA